MLLILHASLNLNLYRVVGIQEKVLLLFLTNATASESPLCFVRRLGRGAEALIEI